MAENNSANESIIETLIPFEKKEPEITETLINALQRMNDIMYTDVFRKAQGFLTQAFTFLCATPERLKLNKTLTRILEEFKKADSRIVEKVHEFLDDIISAPLECREFIEFTGAHTVSNGWFQPTVITTHYLYLMTSAWKDGKLILAIYYKSATPPRVPVATFFANLLAALGNAAPMVSALALPPATWETFFQASLIFLSGLNLYSMASWMRREYIEKEIIDHDKAVFLAVMMYEFTFWLVSNARHIGLPEEHHVAVMRWMATRCKRNSVGAVVNQQPSVPPMPAIEEKLDVKAGSPSKKQRKKKNSSAGVDHDHDMK